MEELNRLFSLEALILITILIIIFNSFLLKERDWKGLILFHTAGFFSFGLEIMMVFNGTRLIISNDFLITILVLLVISWFDAGLFSTMIYENVRKFFKQSEITSSSLIVLNLLFFIGLPISSINWGLTGITILTKYLVINPILQIVLQLACVVLCGSILFFSGYRKLTGFVILMGIILGISFETRLYIAGIRQASNASILTIIINMFTLATMLGIAGTFLLILLGRVNFVTYGDTPPLPTSIMNIRISLTAIKALKSHFGLGTIFSLILELAKMKRRGEPWKDLPETSDDKEIRSRALIGDAIIIYRGLLKRMPQKRAEEIIKDLIIQSSITQLYCLVPLFSKDEILSKNQVEREEVLVKIIEKFPNADWELLESTETTFAYRITRCRLVELVKKVGYPELSDAFCRGDEVYFQTYQKNFNFKRPSLIGEGNKVCDFIFELKINE